MANFTSRERERKKKKGKEKNPTNLPEREANTEAEPKGVGRVPDNNIWAPESGHDYSWTYTVYILDIADTCINKFLSLLEWIWVVFLPLRMKESWLTQSRNEVCYKREEWGIKQIKYMNSLMREWENKWLSGWLNEWVNEWSILGSNPFLFSEPQIPTPSAPERLPLPAFSLCYTLLGRIFSPSQRGSKHLKQVT